MGLGHVVLSVDFAGGERPTWFFVKRVVDDGMKEHVALFGVNSDSTPSLIAYAASILAETEPQARPGSVVEPGSYGRREGPMSGTPWLVAFQGGARAAAGTTCR